MTRTSISLALLAPMFAGVLAAQFMPAPAEQAAKVVAVTGQVSVMHDSVPWALKLGDTIQVRQLIVTGPDGSATFQVSDGSTFEVYPNSQVTFRNNPGSWKDLLDVWLGRVKVHIQKFGGQPNPNRVQTPTAVISVRGTTFDISVDEDENSTFVLVEEGAVEVRHALIPSDKPKLLQAGEYLRVYKNAPLAQKSIDKGQLLQNAYRSLSDALNTMIYRTSRAPGSPLPGGMPGGGPGMSGDTGRPGDTGGSKTPTPAPPPGSTGGAPLPPPPPPF